MPLAQVSGFLSWLNENSLAIQAIVTTVLAATTIYYAWTTSRLFNESRKSRRAAEQQAAAAEQTISFMKQQYEEQLGIAPQIIRQSIEQTKGLIRYWKGEAAGMALNGPDPVQLSKCCRS